MKPSKLFAAGTCFACTLQCARRAEYDKAMAPYMNGTYWSGAIPSSRIETPFSPGVY